MATVLASRTNRRRTIIFTILIAVTLLLMAFSSNPLVRDLQSGLGFAFRPITGTLDEVAGGISSVANAVAEIDRLRVDNAALRDENDRLTTETALNDEIRRENEQLTALLQLRAGFEHETVAADVISRDSSEFRRVVGIGKGSDDGIEPGDVVIAAGGALVGRVSQVGADSATVVLITDATSTVIGQLVSTAGVGQVTGQLDGVLVMSEIDSTEEIDLGVEVVTAGLALGEGVRSPYPKGLLIGQVIDVRRDANSVVQTAYLNPAASLDRLEYVLVITDYQGGLPPLEEQPIDCTPAAEATPDSEGGEEVDPGTLPEGEQPCLQPTPEPTPSPVPSASSAAPSP
jgi:rod shape-determining protein MreC